MTVAAAIRGPKSVPASWLRKTATPERRGQQMLAVNDDQRPEIVVPVGHHRKDTEGSQGRHRGRQHDPPDDTELGDAVHPGGIDQIVRNGHEKLAHQEDTEYRNGKRYDQRGVAVEDSQMMKEQEQRHRYRMGRNEQAEQNRHEQDLPPGKAQLGQRVGARQGDDHLQSENGGGYHQAVYQKAYQGCLGEGGRIVFQYGRVLRPEADMVEKDFRRRLDRGGDHPDKGRQHESGAGQQQQMAKNDKTDGASEAHW